MQNRTDIINMALQRCGAAGINLAFEDSQEAAIAVAAYERSRKYVLSQYRWGFAQKSVALAQGADKPPFGYEYTFPLPGDCVQVVDIHPYATDGEGTIIPGDIFRHRQAKWDIEGRNVVSNFPLLVLRYISSDVEDMPEAFANALAWRLAFEIAPYLQQGTNQAQQFLQLYMQALDEAKVQDGIQERPEEMPDWRGSKQVREQFSSIYERW